MYFDFGTHDLGPRRFDLGLRRADVLRGARNGVLRRRGLRSHRLRLRPDDDLDDACALVHRRALAHEHALAPAGVVCEGVKTLPLVKESDGCGSRTSSARGDAPLITATLLASSVLPVAC